MKTTHIAYKLFKLRKDGSLGPLFINAKLRVPTQEWMPAEDHPTKGFAHRPGWHCCFYPVAPHLKTKVAGQNRVWAKVEIEGIKTYDRPESQGGAWVLADRLKVLGVLDPIQVELLELDYHNRHKSTEERNHIRVQGFFKAIMATPTQA